MTDHAPDCDGFMTVHRPAVERLSGHPAIRRLVCEQDGPVTSFCGKGVTDAELRRMATCRPAEIACDGRCLGAI